MLELNLGGHPGDLAETRDWKVALDAVMLTEQSWEVDVMTDGGCDSHRLISEFVCFTEELIGWAGPNEMLDRQGGTINSRWREAVWEGGIPSLNCGYISRGMRDPIIDLSLDLNKCS